MQSKETANVTNPPNATEGVFGLNLKFASLSWKDYIVCRVNELQIPAKYYKQLSSGKKTGISGKIHRSAKAFNKFCSLCLSLQSWNSIGNNAVA